MATKFRAILMSFFLFLVLFSPVTSSEENTEENHINGGTIESDLTINPDEILHISNSVTVADGVSINILNGGKLNLTGTLTELHLVQLLYLMELTLVSISQM